MDVLRSEIYQQFTEDQAILLFTFPAEVWNMILPKCDSESCLALSNTSTCFKHLLLPRRTEYLFPQVWSIVQDTYSKIQEQTVVEVMEEIATEVRRALVERREPAYPLTTSLKHWICTDPLTRSHLSALKLRLVCKSWRYAIDSSNLKALDKAKTNTRKRLDNLYIQNWMSRQEIKLSSKFNFNEFERTVLQQNSGRVSNLVRAVVITGWSADVFNLLKRMGHLVWYCTIKTYVWSNTTDVIYKNIKNSLSLLPNLKTLELDYWISPHRTNPGSNFENQLLKIVSENPIRKLEKLQALVITKNLPFPIFNELMRSNSHVKILYVERIICSGRYDIYANPMSNLEELSFQIFSEADIEAFWQPSTDWQKTKLYLTIETSNALNWSKLDQLFREKFENNMVTLTVLESKWEGLGKEVAENLQMLDPTQKLIASMRLLPL